ncbi:hypothetical protein RIVM261_052420 [Rivularia sp. IAM M-261]|nr:hypothetical protein RIVM261_052420 [Rivularia sp. IAM M-261]
MTQADNTPTQEQIKMWQVLDEIDRDPGIGRLTPTQQEALVEKFFSKEARTQRLERVRKRKQALELQLASVTAMEKQLTESLNQ